MDSRHCFGDFLPENAVISIFGLTGGIPENGKLSCENDKFTWFGDFSTELILRLVFGLNRISPSECEFILSILCGTSKRFFAIGCLVPFIYNKKIKALCL